MSFTNTVTMSWPSTSGSTASRIESSNYASITFPTARKANAAVSPALFPYTYTKKYKTPGWRTTTRTYRNEDEVPEDQDEPTNPQIGDSYFTTDGGESTTTTFYDYDKIPARIYGALWVESGPVSRTEVSGYSTSSGTSITFPGSGYINEERTFTWTEQAEGPFNQGYMYVCNQTSAGSGEYYWKKQNTVIYRDSFDYATVDDLPEASLEEYLNGYTVGPINNTDYYKLEECSQYWTLEGDISSYGTATPYSRQTSVPTSQDIDGAYVVGNQESGGYDGTIYIYEITDEYDETTWTYVKYTNTYSFTGTATRQFTSSVSGNLRYSFDGNPWMDVDGSSIALASATTLLAGQYVAKPASTPTGDVELSGDFVSSEFTSWGAVSSNGTATARETLSGYGIIANTTYATSGSVHGSTTFSAWGQFGVVGATLSEGLYYLKDASGNLCIGLVVSGLSGTGYSSGGFYVSQVQSVSDSADLNALFEEKALSGEGSALRGYSYSNSGVHIREMFSEPGTRKPFIGLPSKMMLFSEFNATTSASDDIVDSNFLRMVSTVPFSPSVTGRSPIEISSAGTYTIQRTSENLVIGGVSYPASRFGLAYVPLSVGIAFSAGGGGGGGSNGSTSDGGGGGGAVALAVIDFTKGDTVTLTLGAGGTAGKGGTGTATTHTGGTGGTSSLTNTAGGSIVLNGGAGGGLSSAGSGGTVSDHVSAGNITYISGVTGGAGGGVSTDGSPCTISGYMGINSANHQFSNTGAAGTKLNRAGGAGGSLGAGGNGGQTGNPGTLGSGGGGAGYFAMDGKNGGAGGAGGARIFY